MADLLMPPLGFPEDAVVSFTGWYDFLAMDYINPITTNGYTWPTIEHAYQAARCDDPTYLSRLQGCYDRASAAKLVGQSCHDTSNEWYVNREQILLELLQNHYQNTGFQDRLLLTGNSALIYGNLYHDNYLGMAWYRTNEGYDSLRGENILGKLHMQFRDAIRNGGL